jgi:DNA-directed RNA polymerase specialized sigma24 family protein
VVTDFAHPLSKRALDELDEELEKVLLKYARMISGSEARAEDLLQEARLVVCDPDPETGGRPWDPHRGALLAHMRIVLRDLNTKRARSAQARREAPDGGVVAEESSAHPAPDPEEALHRTRDTELERELGRILRTRLKGLPLAVFDRLCQDDGESCEDMARALRCTVKEIYSANRVITYQGNKVLAEYEEAEERRMKAGPSRATTEKKWPEPHAEEEGT